MNSFEEHEILDISRINRVLLVPQLWQFRYRMLGDCVVLPRAPYLYPSKEKRERTKKHICKMLKRVDVAKLQKELLLIDVPYLHPIYYLCEEELRAIKKSQKN